MLISVFGIIKNCDFVLPSLKKEEDLGELMLAMVGNGW